MIPTEAVWQFAHDQKRLLRKTYDDAWDRGAASYEPDEDPDKEPDTPRDVATAGLVGAALLAARRAYRYVRPPAPDPVRRAVALAPSFQGVNRMVGELATLSPTAEQVAAAGSATAAFDAALADWVSGNAWRLDAGVSVAWAGEQIGYGEAADADGTLLGWNSAGDANVCEDCNILNDSPPLPLSEWPCYPGDGATECNVGCRCSLDPEGISILPGDTYAPQFSDAQDALFSKLTDAQANAMAAMMSDAQY